MAVKIIDNSGKANFTPYIEYIKGEKGDKGDKGDAGVCEFIVVNELPTEDIKNAIYLVPAEDAQEQNIFEEYVYINGAWECIGSTGVEVDLSQYVKNTDYPTSTKAGAVKIVSGQYGIGHNDAAGLYTIQASKNEIDAKLSQHLPITPMYLDYAVKKGLTTNTIPLTEEEKVAACEWVGALPVDIKEGELSGHNHLYGRDYNGKLEVIPYAWYAGANTIAIRGANGTLSVGTPTADTDAANKAYVDNAIGDIEAALDNIIAIQENLIGGENV